MGDGSPGGSRKVVNPHTWPVCAKISEGKGEPTQDGAVGLGHQPTQANAGDQCGGGEQAASPDEVYGLIVDRGEVGKTTAVVLTQSPAVAIARGSQHYHLRFPFGTRVSSHTR